MSEASEYLTITEAARRLGVSEPALRRRIDRGLIAIYSSPTDLRSKLIKVRDLKNFMIPELVTPARQGHERGGDAMSAD